MKHANAAQADLSRGLISRNSLEGSSIEEYRQAVSINVKPAEKKTKMSHMQKL